MNTEKLVTKYLDKNYKMTYDSYCNGSVICINTSRFYLVTSIIIEIEEAFALPRKKVHSLVNDWWNNKENQFIEFECGNERESN